MKNKKAIIGVGSRYRRDDGVGPFLIDILQKENLPGVDLIDGGTDALAILDLLPQYEKVVLIDAVYMGAVPGMVKVFKPEEARLKIKSDAMSTHGFGVAEMLSLMEQLDIKTDLTIIGIEPEDLSHGEGLSDVVANQLGPLRLMALEI